MRELIIATKNKGKLREIRELLKDFDLIITSLDDYPRAPRIVESGSSYAENALIKARTIGQYTGKLVLGEDSGLEVDALDGKPGVLSARYAAVNASDLRNNNKLIKELKGVAHAKRKAKYRCFAAFVDGKKEVGIVDGFCTGYITTKPRGTNGFGYDPYFLITRFDKTFGELEPAVKSRISHRALALKKFKTLLTHYLASK